MDPAPSMESWLPPDDNARARSRSPQSYTQPRARRACDRCRYMKVRCQLSVTDPDGQCSRCAKGGWPCNGALPRELPGDSAEARLKALEDQMIAFRTSLETILRPTAVHNLSQGHDASQGAAAGEMVMMANSGGNCGQELSGTASHSTPASPSVEQAYSPLLQSLHDDLEERGRNKRRRVEASLGGSASHITQSSSSTGPQATQKQLQRTGNAHLPSPAATSPTYDLLLDADAANCDIDPLSEPSTLHFISDVIEQGILTLDAAVELFNFWISDLASVTPVVTFPPGTNALSIRRSKPVLFLAILVAGCWVRKTGIQQFLSKEFRRVISLVHIQRGERSLELIQALQVATLWYVLPPQHDRIQIYTWINMAATMAMDIGLDRMHLVSPNETGDSKDRPFKRTAARSGQVGSAEEIRAWLTCYYLCINAGVAYQRPSLLQWTHYMDKCEEIMLGSSLVSDSDRIFCRWVRLAHLAEDVQHGNMGNKPNDILEECRKRLKACNTGLYLGPGSSHLQMYEQIVLINVYERVLRDYKRRNDTIPYTDGVLSLNEESISTHLPHADADVFGACRDSIYNFLDIFLNLDDEDLSSGPIFTFSRIVYAVLVLLKIYLVSRDSDAGLDKALSRTRIELYFNAIIENLGRVKGDGSSPGARMFQNTLRTFQKWLQNQPKVSITIKGSNSTSCSTGSTQETKRNHERRSSENFDTRNTGLDKSLRLPLQPATPSERSLLPAVAKTRTKPNGELDSEEAPPRNPLATQTGSLFSSQIRAEVDVLSNCADISDPWNSAFVPSQEENVSDLLWSELNIDPLSGELMNNVNVMFQDWLPDLFPPF